MLLCFVSKRDTLSLADVSKHLRKFDQKFMN